MVIKRPTIPIIEKGPISRPIIRGENSAIKGLSFFFTLHSQTLTPFCYSAHVQKGPSRSPANPRCKLFRSYTLISLGSCTSLGHSTGDSFDSVLLIFRFSGAHLVCVCYLNTGRQLGHLIIMKLVLVLWTALSTQIFVIR